MTLPGVKMNALLNIIATAYVFYMFPSFILPVLYFLVTSSLGVLAYYCLFHRYRTGKDRDEIDVQSLFICLGIVWYYMFIRSYS